jgi:hypothetical protein
MRKPGWAGGEGDRIFLLCKIMSGGMLKEAVIHRWVQKKRKNWRIASFFFCFEWRLSHVQGEEDVK